MEKQEVFHIGLAFDQNFIIPFYVAITSIFSNNKEATIALHTITSGVSSEEQEEIKQYVQQNKAAIYFYEIDRKLVESFHIHSQHFTAAAFYRLFLPAVLPKNVKRFIYFDIDIVVNANLAKFYEIDLEGFPMAAALDPGVVIRPELGLYKEHNYFNSGVLFIDANLWRYQRITEKAIQYIVDNPEKIPYADQDALNAIMIGNWLKIGNEFNLQRGNVPNMNKRELQALLEKAIIIHYTSSDKPWNPYCTHPFKYLYWLYLSKSPKALHKRYAGVKLFKILAASYINNIIVSFYLNNPIIINTWRKLRA